MDYKYIEQLLERYWECETTLQEEAILRQFFAQEDVPSHLMCYRDLFAAEHAIVSEHLSEDFDQRMMQLIEESDALHAEKEDVVQARRIKFSYRLRPLFKAAAVVAMVLSVSLAVQQAMYQEQEDNVVNLPPAVVPGAPSTAYEQPTAPSTLPDSLAHLQEVQQSINP